MIFFKEDSNEINEYIGYDLYGLYIDGKHILDRDRLFYIEIPLDDDEYGFEIYDYKKKKVLYDHNSYITLKDNFNLDFFKDSDKMLPQEEVTLCRHSFEFTPTSKKFSCYEFDIDYLIYPVFYKKLELLEEYKNKILSSEKTLKTKSELFKVMAEKCALLDSRDRSIDLENYRDFVDDLDFIVDYSSEDPVLKNMTSGFFEHIVENKKNILPDHEKLLEFLVQNPEASNNVAIKEVPINKNTFYKYHTHVLKKYKKESE